MANQAKLIFQIFVKPPLKFTSKPRVLKILPLTRLNPKIYKENLAKPLIPLDRRGGGGDITQ
jgi:hypothetical protein